MSYKNCYILYIIGECMNKDFYLSSYSDVIKKLNTSIDTGLSNNEADKLIL